MNVVSPKRQLEIVRQVARSGSNKEAAHVLGISEPHVKNVLSSAFKQHGATSIANLLYILWLRDLWDEDDWVND
jgi:DNA-binding CsgD family transcriptional regulator